MKFTVPGCHVKLLGKAVHSLAKIGDDIYIEPSADSLSLRAVNSSRSAYATYNFGSSFFSSITPTSDTPAPGEEGRCKVMVRSLLLAFRSLSVLDKTVDSCVLETGVVEDKLLLGLHCRHKVEKRFQVGLVECEAVRAVYNTDNASNTWTVQAKVLQEANGNFLANQEEVTMHVTQHAFKMNNFADECADEKKLVHTELSMQPGEFETYSIGEDTNLTFCLKELKSLIAFADYLSLPITANFNLGGSPLVLTATTGPGMISCVYVLATLADPGASTAAMPRVSDTPAVKKPPAVARKHSENIPPAIPPPPLFLSETVESTPALGRGNSTQAAPSFPGMDSLSLSAIPEPGEMGDGEMAEEGQDTMVSTPPAKRKKRQLFRRCFEKTFNPSLVPGTERILAPDSDEEN